MLTASLVFATMLPVAGKISRGYRLEDRKRDRTMVARRSTSWLCQIFFFTSLVRSLWERAIWKTMWWGYQEYIWRNSWMQERTSTGKATASPVERIAITSASCQAALLWFAETRQPRFENSCGWWEANFQHCSFKLWVVSCTHPGNRIQRVLFAPRGTTWILLLLSQACSSLFSWPMDWYLRRRLRSCIRPLVLCCRGTIGVLLSGFLV